jgi:hypothetical protein
MERIVHNRILLWCKNNNIFIDEQSGFSTGRRLQTRIISLIEEIRLTIAANNSPALTIFVDFLSAFDRMWHPALITNLYDLNMPLPLLKWIFNWLKGRTFCIHYGDEHSRTVQMKIGAPQGSVLAATLFRLHIHFLPTYINGIIFHLFADDLALVLTGSIEKRFSENIIELEFRAAVVMRQLEKFSDDLILPTNVSKTKVMLIHSIVSPSYPRIYYKSQSIEYVKRFKYLGVSISVKLGWKNYINERIKIIRKIYAAMKIIFKTIRRKNIDSRRKIFLAYALPHFLWLFCTWFFFTEKQRERVEHVFCSGIRIVYNLHQWDDLTTSVLAQELTLRDYLFTYWRRFVLHLLSADEALAFQQSWNTYLIITSPDPRLFGVVGLRQNSAFFNRLRLQAKSCLIDWLEFDETHCKQYGYFKNSTVLLADFIYKYFLTSFDLP